VTAGTGDCDAVVFFREGGHVTCSDFGFVFVEVQFAEVGMEREVFDLAFFEVFRIIRLHMSDRTTPNNMWHGTTGRG
jgi:hypothetical protein